MLKQRISDNWYFRYRGSQKQPVTLPHDMVVTLPRSPEADGGAGNGYWPSAFGTYFRYLPPAEAACTILDVDGAYMLAEVMLNGHQMSLHPHGYTPYLTNLTSLLSRTMTNKLEIQVSSLQPSARWYSGGGIYRDVYLWTGGSVRIEPWDLFITTRGGIAYAAVDVQGTITADEHARTKVILTVKNADGVPVAETDVAVTAKPGEKTPFNASLSVSAPRLWDLDAPYLYTLEAKVYAGGKLTDTSAETFGIRMMTWDVENGFCLNGRNVKLRGGCIHHDHGVLGAASYPDAEERKVRLLKEAGFNALRIAHNPPSLALLEVCDRLGMLVMDEAFDMWRIGKAPLDYHQWFETWWETDLACMIRRDRNHPCVACYSIGNEIVERTGRSDGAEWSAKLCDEARKWDSTRPITSAVCGEWPSFEPEDSDEYRRYMTGGTLEHNCDERLDSKFAEMTEAYMAPLDIVGYNYLYQRYLHDHALYPQRIIWSSETHALTIYDCWELITQHPWLLGDFTWTAIDNLGEVGTGRGKWAREGVITGIYLEEYPWRTCWQGDLDLCGCRRPQSYYRETVWGLRQEPVMFTTHPEHYGEGYTGTAWHWWDIHDTWTFEDAYLGKPVKTEVYTDADEAEFFLNGESLGRAKAEKCIASMDIPYTPGTVTAVVYKDGVRTGSVSLTTTGVPASLALKAEKASIPADGRALAYVQIALLDSEDRRIVERKDELTCTVEGGKLLGIFSADPCNEDSYGTNVCHAFDGRALAIVTADKPGTVKVTVSCSGIPDAAVVITAQ